MKKIEITILVLTYFVLLPDLFCQTINNDSIIFKTIDETDAFSQWQYFWKKVWNGFSLNDFYLENEQKLNSRVREHFTFKSLQEKDELSFTFFSPNGLKAIDPFSYDEVFIHDSIYIVGKDDYNDILFFDFTKDTSYYIFPLYHYGPTLNGITWLSDSVFIMVGAIFKEIDSKEYLPLIYIFNVDLQKVRTYKGKVFPLSDELILAMDFFVNEPKLIFKYGKNRGK